MRLPRIFLLEKSLYSIKTECRVTLTETIQKIFPRSWSVPNLPGPQKQSEPLGQSSKIGHQSVIYLVKQKLIKKKLLKKQKVESNLNKFSNIHCRLESLTQLKNVPLTRKNYFFQFPVPKICANKLNSRNYSSNNALVVIFSRNNATSALPELRPSAGFGPLLLEDPAHGCSCSQTTLSLPVLCTQSQYIQQTTFVLLFCLQC